MYKSLEDSIQKAKGKIFSVGIKDTGYATGYMGAYARLATENNLIYIGFTNSMGWTVPHGTKKGIWGTNPITVGIPNSGHPIIFDAASTKISIGDILIAKASQSKLPSDVVLDSSGKHTTDPEKAYEAKNVLPIAEHKGSGLAYIIELLAGGLTNSRLGNMVNSGWGGSFYILIDPTIFRSLNDFKTDVATSIKELKGLPKTEGVDNVYYPGEKSSLLRENNLDKDIVEIESKLWEKLNKI